MTDSTKRVDDACPRGDRGPLPMAPDGCTKTILLAEDAADFRRFLARVLRHLGYTVIEAGDGAEALEAGQSCNGSVDLLVTDLNMPELDGCSLAEALGRERSGMPVIYMSGHSAEMLRREGRLPEGATFLRKPFMVDELAARVRQLVGVSAAVSCMDSIAAQ